MARRRAAPIEGNVLYYGDNLEILRDKISANSVDLVYLDPPFNSNASYNVLFADKHGTKDTAQIHAFEDTWTWTPETERLYTDLLRGAVPAKVADAIHSMHGLLDETDMLAYVVMMAPRLVELHKVLKATGSLYLHCDPTASHYLKILLDAVFGPTHFRNEIIWRRTGAHGKSRRYAPIHDVILFFTKSDDYKWTWPKKPHMRGHVEQFLVKDGGGYRTNYYGNVLTGSGLRGGESGKPWRGFDPSAKNRHWAIPKALLDEIEEDLSGLRQHQKLDRLYDLGYITITPGEAWPIYNHRVDPAHGAAIPDIWAFQPYTEGTVFGTEEGVDADVRWLSPRDKERLGYQTQKPVALMERIIKASSNEGDLVLDPFCGCGTTVAAAQALNRRWIGIDITYLAVDIIHRRLKDTYGSDDFFTIDGKPRDVAGAEALFKSNPLDFQRWAVSCADGQPSEKATADRGIDGTIRFPTGKTDVGRALVSVKGGATVNPAMVRELKGTVETERAEMGVLITLVKPTPGMVEAANRAGNYTWPVNGQAYPKIQLVTVKELLEGKRPNMPPSLTPYMTAQRHVPAVDQPVLANGNGNGA